jgi:hypothetical protein
MSLRISSFRLVPASMRSHYSTQQAIPPGLHFIPEFLNRRAQEQLLAKSLRLYEQIKQKAEDAAGIKATTYLSKQHNLQSEEYYKLIKLEDEQGKSQDLQHFEKYGEEGHTLTYFIGTKNIPAFIKEALIAPMAQLQEVKALETKSNWKTLDWNFTFNTYTPPNNYPGRMPGFDFHRDTPSNGEITAIFTLLAEADVQMKKDWDSPISYTARLIPGSLFLLSWDARWQWLHRVLPRDVPPLDSVMIRRISLVLGCK